MKREPALAAGLCAVLVALAVSAWQPHDRLTWLMEVLPVLVAVPILLATYRRFPLTTLVYAALGVHALVLLTGGHYTYARVPFGYWLQEWLHLGRNPYDKIGHFAQGFVPALLTREILLRGRYVRTPRMLSFLVLCVVLAISAVYELIEWQSALLLGEGATDFLGTQGDPWDTQSDMGFALLGGAAALLLSRVQDRQLARLPVPAHGGSDAHRD